MAQSEYLSWFLNTLMIKDLREKKTHKFTILSIMKIIKKKLSWTRATIGGGPKCCGYLNKHNNKIRFPLFSNW